MRKRRTAGTLIKPTVLLFEYLPAAKRYFFSVKHIPAAADSAVIIL